MKKSFKRIICMALIAVMVVGSFTVVSFGTSKSNKMTAYNCIKSGNYVYCAAGNKIIKVNLKNGKKTSLKIKYAKNTDTVGVMSLHKGYLYYECFTSESGDPDVGLCRIKTNGKSSKVLISGATYYFEYAVKGKKIYYKDIYHDSGYYTNKVMNLNGSKKKKTSTKISTKYANSNAKGYKVVGKDVDKADGSYVINYYLKLPSGKMIYLNSYRE